MTISEERGPCRGKRRSEGTGFPCFVKPKFGKGSWSSHRGAGHDDLECRPSNSREDAAIRECLLGEEWLVGVASHPARAPLFAVLGGSGASSAPAAADACTRLPRRVDGTELARIIGMNVMAFAFTTADLTSEIAARSRRGAGRLAARLA
jgi:hypothetical protein